MPNIDYFLPCLLPVPLWSGVGRVLQNCSLTIGRQDHILYRTGLWTGLPLSKRSNIGSQEMIPLLLLLPPFMLNIVLLSLNQREEDFGGPLALSISRFCRPEWSTIIIRTVTHSTCALSLRNRSAFLCPSCLFLFFSPTLKLGLYSRP